MWLDVGTDDALRAATQQFANALTDAGDAPELRLAPGGHTRVYWGAHLHDYGKTARPGRKVGHVTVTASDTERLEARLVRVHELCDCAGLS